MRRSKLLIPTISCSAPVRLRSPARRVDAAARHADVISFNCYDLDASEVIDAYAATGKPCLIGEFSFRGGDSGLPNTNGAGPLVASQGERATCFRRQ